MLKVAAILLFIAAAVDAEEKCRILVTHPEVPKEGLDLLSDSCEVIVCQSIPPSRTEILDKVKGVHALYWASHEHLNAEILDKAGPQLKTVSTMSAGIDYVDINELKKRNITLGHTPTVLNAAVADLAVGLMLSAARRFHEGRLKIESSNWNTNHINWMWGQDVKGATVGFYGFGNIGRTIAARLKGFEISGVLYNTRRRVPDHVEKQLSATQVPFDELLKKSDILFIAAPLTNETAGVFNGDAFKSMKKTAVFVNVARGPIVNQADLYNALKSNEIFAAGIDVMEKEPLDATDPLLSLPNLVITPHLGSATASTRTDMSVIAAHNVLRGLAGEPMFAPAY